MTSAPRSRKPVGGGAFASSWKSYTEADIVRSGIVCGVRSIASVLRLDPAMFATSRAARRDCAMLSCWSFRRASYIFGRHRPMTGWCHACWSSTRHGIGCVRGHRHVCVQWICGTLFGLRIARHGFRRGVAVASDSDPGRGTGRLSKPPCANNRTVSSGWNGRRFAAHCGG